MSSPNRQDRSEFHDSPQYDGAGETHLPDDKVLEEILERTSEAVDGGSGITRQEVESLVAVAEHYRHQELCLDPITIELVEAILRTNYGHLQKDPQFWQTMSVKMAGVLYDSPAALARMQNLWSRLQEVNQ